MRVLVGSVLFLLLASLPAEASQSASADETAIRRLVQKYDVENSIPMAKDAIFWSGAIKRPVIGNERGEEVANGREPSLRVPNSTKRRTDIQRIDVAKSGDMAYEFSNAEFSFDMKSGKRETIRNSMLRVWKKEGGEWKVTAWFARALE